MYSTRATKSGTHCPPHLTHSFICILMGCCECVGTRYLHLRDLGAADLNMSLLPPVGRACSEADMQLTVCRVLLAAGIKPAYRSSTASKLALGLVASGWLLGCARAHSQAAPTSQLLQRPCSTQDGSEAASVSAGSLSSIPMRRAHHSEPTAQSSKAGLGVARWCSTRVTVWDHHCHM